MTMLPPNDDSPTDPLEAEQVTHRRRDEERQLYELVDQPELDDPVMILALDGWIDAGSASEAAAQHIVSTLAPEPIATFDTDALLDYRSRRPILRLVDGVARELVWPTVELSVALDESGRDLLLLRGAEPDHLWRTFSGQIADLALSFGCAMVIGIGAYPAPLPHTRRSRLSATATRPDLADRPGWVRGTLDVPAGIQPVIESAAASLGIPSLGVWAQVPHYAAAMPYPAAALRLLEGVIEVTGLTFDLTTLATASESSLQRLSELVDNSEEHQALVHQLERHVDDAANAEEELPSGDELAAEFQRFLRQQRPGNGPGPLGG
ncbi:MAG TPA: PAC2 family protein [Acidimicrobiales bacterium]|jgi:hypothetical protein